MRLLKSRIAATPGARLDYAAAVDADTLRPLERLQSDEGPALGAAVTALAALETCLRKERGVREPFTVADAVPILVRFRDSVAPNPAWRDAYRKGLRLFDGLVEQAQT